MSKSEYQTKSYRSKCEATNGVVGILDHASDRLRMMQFESGGTKVAVAGYSFLRLLESSRSAFVVLCIVASLYPSEIHPGSTVECDWRYSPC